MSELFHTVRVCCDISLCFCLKKSAFLLEMSVFFVFVLYTEEVDNLTQARYNHLVQSLDSFICSFSETKEHLIKNVSLSFLMYKNLYLFDKEKRQRIN